ncbi:MAG: hypothetical protein ACE5KG_03105 [Nitrososphaerales archaeon]
MWKGEKGPSLPSMHKSGHRSTPKRFGAHHFLAKKKAMNNQRERIKRIAEEVTEDVSKRMEFTQNVFEFRGDGLRQKETGSSIWILRFWFQGHQGINFEISVTEDSTDESIKADIAVVLARQRLDYGDRL